jgi:hypothetical protein
MPQHRNDLPPELRPVRLARDARRELQLFIRSLEPFNAHLTDEDRNEHLDATIEYLIALRRVRGLPDLPEPVTREHGALRRVRDGRSR